MRRKNVTKRGGFTLVELLVVIVILAMLSGIVAPKLITQIDKAKFDSCRAKMTPVESAIDAFLLNTSSYPNSLEELVVDPGIQGWVGPYLKESQLYDPWNNPFLYSVTNNGYEIVSYGQDGLQGGDGFNSDIYND